MRTMKRTRDELATFLRSRRERLSPNEVGLPSGGRRRTPGLRREEVAALAGVGLTWYTWLEQGRDIGVSTAFLENLSRVLKLDAAERRHLFLLAHERPPTDQGKTWCVVPALIRRLMDDIAQHPAYVLNLRWDVLAYNDAANRLFCFEHQPSERRNLLWMLFTDPVLLELFPHWEEEAPRILSSFRRDYANASHDCDIKALVDELKKVSPEFHQFWKEHDVHAPCNGSRELKVDGETITFEHTSLIIDADRHLRLVVYAKSEQD
ncbi:helix-turn-helix transcriptional regulator [Celerinatantimonas sp. YJH-8]|uniref:helix-turn-helix transcriptional regulator n=1 Tax=Celerinatantimonas sp. YJH-8 TaxID=3228714 RepID=UPI0038C6AF22